MFAHKFIRKTQESFTSKFVKILVVKLAVLRINFLARCRDTSGVFLFSRPLYPLIPTNQVHPAI